MRRTWFYGKALLLVALWDWLLAVSTRYLAEGDWRAVPLAVALTTFWLFGTRWAVSADNWGKLMILVGAATGTALGLLTGVLA